MGARRGKSMSGDAEIHIPTECHIEELMAGPGSKDFRRGVLLTGVISKVLQQEFGETFVR